MGKVGGRKFEKRRRLAICLLHSFSSSFSSSSSNCTSQGFEEKNKVKKKEDNSR